jgi:ribonuclease HI
MKVFVDGMCLNNHIKDVSKRDIYICININDDFIVSHMTKPLQFLSSKLGYNIAPSNNVAEYVAILNALRNFKDVDDIEIYSDSEVVVNQINGKYKVKDKNLFTLYCELNRLLFQRKQEGKTTKIIQVKGKENPANLHLKKLQSRIKNLSKGE